MLVTLALSLKNLNIMSREFAQAFVVQRSMVGCCHGTEAVLSGGGNFTFRQPWVIKLIAKANGGVL
jgi:hypothetical protein